eukprot:PhM_4_TR16060/c0_g1_i1/m.42079
MMSLGTARCGLPIALKCLLLRVACARSPADSVKVEPPFLPSKWNNVSFILTDINEQCALARDVELLLRSGTTTTTTLTLFEAALHTALVSSTMLPHSSAVSSMIMGGNGRGEFDATCLPSMKALSLAAADWLLLSSHTTATLSQLVALLNMFRSHSLRPAALLYAVRTVIMTGHFPHPDDATATTASGVVRLISVLSRFGHDGSTDLWEEVLPRLLLRTHPWVLDLVALEDLVLVLESYRAAGYMCDVLFHEVECRVLARCGGQLSAADHERRMVLLAALNYYIEEDHV